MLNNENGRSMIEMLGVLAIIGVLSVGGIAGYSKAMMKYRVNKTIEQISLISGNIRTFFRGRYEDLYSSNSVTIIKKAKLIPDEMWSSKTESVYIGAGQYEDRTTNFISTALGNEISIGTPNLGGVVEPSTFYFYLESVPQDACIELLTQNWSNISSDFIGISIVNSGRPYLITESGCDESQYFTACKNGNIPVSLDTAANVCNESNSIMMKFQ